jgi:hypothetical protein
MTVKTWIQPQEIDNVESVVIVFDDYDKVYFAIVRLENAEVIKLELEDVHEIINK